jgi:hypothetical protein
MEVINLNDYAKPWTKIFENSNCKVYKVKSLKESKEYVLKVITFSEFEKIDEHYTEVLIHAKAMPHPNILNMLGRRVVIELQ